MLAFGKTLLFFSAILIVSSFFNFPFLSVSYASNGLLEDEKREKQGLVVNARPTQYTSFESLGFNPYDSEDEDLETQALEQTILENDGKCYRCCLGFYRATPCWTETTATLALVASSIILPIISYVSFDESTRRVIGTIGTFVALTGVMAKVYGWCLVSD